MSESRIIVYGLNTASQTYQPLEINTAGQTSVNITGFAGDPVLLQSQDAPQFRRADGSTVVGDQFPIVGALNNMLVDPGIQQSQGTGRTAPSPTNSLDSFSGGTEFINTGSVTVQSATSYNYGWRGLIAVIAPSTITTSIQVEIVGILGGQNYSILQSAVLTTTDRVILRVYPGLVAVANLTVNDLLPQTWAMTVTSVGDAATNVYLAMQL